MELNSTSLLWFLAFLFLITGGIGFGGNRGPAPVTQAELTMGLNNQSVMNELNQLGLATQQNNYEMARLISDQNLMMQTQNSTNQIAVINGFNQISNKIDALSAQVSACCCELKTQMLQYKLDDANAKIVAQQTEISNNAQSQYLLGQMGKWTANAPAAAA